MSGVPHPGPPPGDHARGGPAPQAQTPATVGHGGDHGRPAGDQVRNDTRDLWPRDFGRDGVSGLVSLDRAMRARDVSRPTVADEAAADDALTDLLARVEGRGRSDYRPRPARTTQGADVQGSGTQGSGTQGNGTQGNGTQRGASDRSS